MMFVVLCAQRNQKTPERATIEKPLYFCSAEFVGQFAACDQGLAPAIKAWHPRLGTRGLAPMPRRAPTPGRTMTKPVSALSLRRQPLPRARRRQDEMV